MTDVKRMWINQPYAMQPHHDRHGELVLASLNKWGRSYTVWPLSGNVSSQYMLRECLSEGWPEHLRPRSESLVKATAELNVLGGLLDSLTKGDYPTWDGKDCPEGIIAEIDRRIKSIDVAGIPKSKYANLLCRDPGCKCAGDLAAYCLSRDPDCKAYEPKSE